MVMTMGTTGHPVGYYEMNTTERIKEWLRNQYTWDTWQVLELAPGTKRRSNWWLAIQEKETGKIRAMLVITSNRAKREGMFYTKELDEFGGPYATDIPKRLFSMLTPLEPEESPWAQEWRDKVSNGLVRG
jgi:hypothetical protein